MEYRFYTYMWLREDGPPYYVGKGSGNRAFKKRRVGNPPADRVHIDYWPDEKTAFDAEKALIAKYGRKDNGTGCLSNLTDGGDSPPNHRGKKRSAEWHRKQSKVKKGRPGRKQSQATCEKRRLAMIGRTFSQESIDRMRIAQTGKRHSEETKNKLRLIMKGRNKGVPWSQARRESENRRKECRGR